MPTDHQRALEAPHEPPPGSPLWSENYAWVAYDPDAGAGVLMHRGRMSIGQDLWRAMVVAYLPNGELVVSKSVSPSPADTVGTSNLSLVCEEPIRCWRLRFRGAGRRTSTVDLASSRLVDDGLVALDVDLTFEYMTPIWDLGAMMTLGDTHYEQHGRYTGTISANGEIHTIDAPGYRDHSTGKRDLAGLGGHVWAHAIFPSGRAFTAFQASTPDGQLALNDGVIITGDQLNQVAPLEVPTLTGATGAPHAVTIGFPNESPITGEIVHGAQLSLGEPNDFHFGFDPAFGRKVMLDCPARFEWNGEVTHGWLERSAIL